MSDNLSDKEISALLSLLDDSDNEIVHHISEKIVSIGEKILPYLEYEWETNFNPLVQQRIEDLVHKVQFNLVKTRLENWKNSKDQDVMEGLWITATYLYPDLELTDLQNKIEVIKNQLLHEIDNEELTPEKKIEKLNNHFFKHLKFSANTKNFHSPSNSMINCVLDTHKGNPIGLCSIYMVLGKKLNLPLYGINLPNLFVLTYKDKDKQFYINVFNRGLIFTKND